MIPVWMKSRRIFELRGCEASNGERDRFEGRVAAPLYGREPVLRVPFDKNEGVVKAQMSGPVV